MGMASATGIEADGSQSEFYGAAPDATLIDIRIGTDVGAGPFENYLLEQQFYESAMNGLQWVMKTIMMMLSPGLLKSIMVLISYLCLGG